MCTLQYLKWSFCKPDLSRALLNKRIWLIYREHGERASKSTAVLFWYDNGIRVLCTCVKNRILINWHKRYCGRVFHNKLHFFFFVTTVGLLPAASAVNNSQNNGERHAHNIITCYYFNKALSCGLIRTCPILTNGRASVGNR